MTNLNNLSYCFSSSTLNENNKLKKKSSIEKFTNENYIKLSDEYYYLMYEISLNIRGFIDNKIVMREIIDLHRIQIEKFKKSIACDSLFSTKSQKNSKSTEIFEYNENSSNESINDKNCNNKELNLTYLGLLTAEDAEKKMKHNNMVKIYHQMPLSFKNKEMFEDIPLFILHRISKKKFKHCVIIKEKNKLTNKIEYSLDDNICNKKFDNCDDLLNEYIQLKVLNNRRKEKYSVEEIQISKRINFLKQYYFGVKNKKEVEEFLKKSCLPFLIYYKVPCKSRMIKAIYESLQLSLVCMLQKGTIIHLPIKKFKESDVVLYSVPYLKCFCRIPKFNAIIDLIIYFLNHEKVLRRCCKLYRSRHLNI